MKKKLSKQNIDKQLLETIYALQWEWKQNDSIVESSMEPSDISVYRCNLARAKYLFLLREARIRNVNATRYL